MSIRILLIVCALAGMLIGCESREYTERREEHIYEFDGSQPLDNIKLIATAKDRRDPIYTPQLSSQDFYQLALRTFPTDTSFDKMRLVNVEAWHYPCLSNPQHIDGMIFEWSMPDVKEPDLRLRIRVIVNATTGNVNALWEYKSGDHPAIATGPAVEPARAEVVIKAALDAFVKSPDDASLRSAKDCDLTAFAFDPEPHSWQVEIGSSNLKRVTTYSVDSVSLETSRRK